MAHTFVRSMLDFEQKYFHEKIPFDGNLSNWCMVDYQCVSDIKWVHMPFVHISLLPCLLRSLSDELEVGLIKDLRVLSESFLSQKRDALWDEGTKSYVQDTITNREHLFGHLYERSARFKWEDFEESLLGPGGGK